MNGKKKSTDRKAYNLPPFPFISVHAGFLVCKDKYVAPFKTWNKGSEREMFNHSVQLSYPYKFIFLREF